MNNYYTILPSKIRYDRDLPPSAKILYSELVVLCAEQGFCWASNGYFARLYGVDKATVSRWISKLNKRGYIFFKSIDENATGDDNFINEYRQIYLASLDENINPNNKNKNKKSNISRAKSRSKKESFSGAYDLEQFDQLINSK